MMRSRGNARRPGPIASLYRDPYQYELLAQMTAPPDIPLYAKLVEEHGGPLAELACGTGRVCLSLARPGLAVTGLDNSPQMIEYARARAEAAGRDVTLVVGDMRDFDLDAGGFALIVVPYNAFNHLYSLEDITGCLDSVKRHMNADARFVIDTFNPDPQKLTSVASEPTKLLEYLDPVDGERVRLVESTRYDPAAQINHITWTYEVEGGRERRVDELSMRIFFPRELEALLTLNGFEIEKTMGDYDGSPFASDAPKQIVICRTR